MRIVALGIVLVTLAIYRPVASAPLLYEDANWSGQLTDRHDPQVFARFPGRGLTQWTFYQQAVNGVADPRPLHLGNVVLHLLCGWLVYRLARQMGVARLGAAVASAVFLWHPLNTQAVAYVSARADLLMVLWTLTAVLVARSGAGVWRWSVVLAACVLASVSKELGVLSFAFVALSMGWWVPMLYAGLAAIPLGVAVVTWPTWATWAELASGNVIGIWRVLAIFVVPVGMSIDPDPYVVPMALRVVGLVALLVASVWAWKRERLAAAWLALVLVPRVLVPTFEPIHDHHAYLALVPLAMLTGRMTCEG